MTVAEIMAECEALGVALRLTGPLSLAAGPGYLLPDRLRAEIERRKYGIITVLHYRALEAYRAGAGRSPAGEDEARKFRRVQ